MPPARTAYLNWLDPLKALALLAVMWNHLCEEFGRHPWFTNPSRDWPPIGERLRDVYPTDHPFPLSLLQLLGWLGDAAPGVFILASGVGLMWAIRQRPQGAAPGGFYKRRLLRIYPLYVTVHLGVLAVDRLLGAPQLPVGHTVLSLLGLRGTPALFFAYCPSWWFIWLILQLYAVFPLLVALLDRLGRARFFALTCAFTVGARIYGLLFVEPVYYYLTGMFFGCRLAEFTAGMVLGDWLWSAGALPRPRQALVAGGAMYAAGLLLSLSWPGAAASNLVVTLGMSGLLFALWAGLLRRSLPLSRAVRWLGAQSFAIYLVHQAPLGWARLLFPEDHRARLVLSALGLALSVPAGWLVSAAVERQLGRLGSRRPR